MVWGYPTDVQRCGNSAAVKRVPSDQFIYGVHMCPCSLRLASLRLARARPGPSTAQASGLRLVRNLTWPGSCVPFGSMGWWWAPLVVCKIQHAHTMYMSCKLCHVHICVHGKHFLPYAYLTCAAYAVLHYIEVQLHSLNYAWKMCLRHVAFEYIKPDKKSSYIIRTKINNWKTL